VKANDKFYSASRCPDADRDVTVTTLVNTKDGNIRLTLFNVEEQQSFRLELSSEEAQTLSRRLYEFANSMIGAAK
jgi:hypothetical protein